MSEPPRDGFFPPVDPSVPPVVTPSVAPSGWSGASPVSGTPMPPVSSPEGPEPRQNWWINLGLFLATAASIFVTGTAEPWNNGLGLALPLLAILVSHEAGHYVLARWHGESTSLPYFIPAPLLSPFGTLGAVIVAKDRIRSRRALLDIGAAGPLAGMIVCVPLMVYGLTLSRMGPIKAEHYVQEGQSLLYWLLKRVALGPMPEGQDVLIHPVAGAAWTGILVTFLNLFPIGQLDGGHVAYALFGRGYARMARWAALLPVGLVVYNLWAFGRPAFHLLLRGAPVPESTWSTLTSATSPWVVLLLLFGLMKWRMGLGHPPVDDETPLGWGRKAIAVTTLLLFVAVFMPSPWVMY